MSFLTMGEIHDLSRQIDSNDLTFSFLSPNLNPINFIGFKDPLYFYKNVFNADTSIEKAEKYPKKINLDIAVIKTGNPKHRSYLQVNTIQNIKNLYNATEEVIKLLNDYDKIESETKHRFYK